MTTFHHAIYFDRKKAANVLASQLLLFKDRMPLIMAIPRGGVPIGEIVADRLDGQMTLILVHKLCAPNDREQAIGAIDDQSWCYVEPHAKQLGATEAYLAEEKLRQLDVLKARRRRYSPYAEAVEPMERIVIVVDDGLATGATMSAALHSIRARNPAYLVCAVPVASEPGLKKILPLADAVVCPHVPEGFASVGEFYEEFPQVSDQEVMRALSKRRHRTGGPKHAQPEAHLAVMDRPT